jgi:guanylate kinase
LLDLFTGEASVMSGKLILFVGISGAGKNTLMEMLVKKLNNGEPFIEQESGQISFRPSVANIVVSTTTRTPRKGEKPGIDYHFLSHEEFTSQVKSGRFSEYARVHDHLYGTRNQDIDAALQAAKFSCHDIDIQGAQRILRRYPQAMSVLVSVDLNNIAERLSRRSETKESIRRRLLTAANELKAFRRFPFDITVENNGAPELALEDLCKKLWSSGVID